MTFQKKEEPLPIRGRRHHPERSSTLMRFPMRSYGYIHGHPHGHVHRHPHGYVHGHPHGDAHQIEGKRDRERKGPVPEDTGPTPNRGCIQGHPTGLGHLPEEVVAHRLENGKKLARLQPALSMLADTIVPVDRRPLARVERDRPATAGRRCRASRGAAQRKGAEMRDSGKGPRGGPIIWLMAVIAVCLAPAVHPIAADVILTALAVWAMRNSR